MSARPATRSHSATTRESTDRDRVVARREAQRWPSVSDSSDRRPDEPHRTAPVDACTRWTRSSWCSWRRRPGWTRSACGWPRSRRWQQWWSKGIGSPVLHSLIPALLGSPGDRARRRAGASRTRAARGGQPARLRPGPGARRAPRGAVRHRAGRPRLDRRPGRAVRDAGRAGRGGTSSGRCITVVPGTPVATLDQARAVVAGTGGGIVLDVSPRTHTADRVDELVVELGPALGYVRVPAAELADGGTPGLLATLPPQVAVAIGGSADGRAGAAGDHGRRPGRPGARAAGGGRRDAPTPVRGALRAESPSRRHPAGLP